MKLHGPFQVRPIERLGIKLIFKLYSFIFSNGPKTKRSPPFVFAGAPYLHVILRQRGSTMKEESFVKRFFHELETT